MIIAISKVRISHTDILRVCFAGFGQGRRIVRCARYNENATMTAPDCVEWLAYQGCLANQIVTLMRIMVVVGTLTGVTRAARSSPNRARSGRRTPVWTSCRRACPMRIGR